MILPSQLRRVMYLLAQRHSQRPIDRTHQKLIGLMNGTCFESAASRQYITRVLLDLTKLRYIQKTFQGYEPDIQKAIFRGRKFSFAASPNETMIVEQRPTYLPFGRPDFSDEEIAAVTRVLRSGWVGMGPEVRAFEDELASYVMAPQLVAVSSCTAALHLTLHALGVGAGDEVICPSLTWCSSANAALYVGARVVFSDVDRDSCCSQPEDILRCVTPQTRAVVVVHFGGYAIDVHALRRQVPAHVLIVEDAAHALGARYPDGSPVGSSGNPTCYSFYANKNLSTAEGGAVALFDERLAESLRCLRQHAYPADAWKRFNDRQTVLTAPLEELGFKANYTDLQASIGRVQLRRFEELQRRRLEIASYYCSRIEGMRPRLEWQAGICHNDHARHLFTIRLPIEQLHITRDEFVRELRKRNIGATIHYTPLHQMPLYQERCGNLNLPHTDHLGMRIVTLPFSSSMTLPDACDVCDHLDECLRQFSSP